MSEYVLKLLSMLLQDIEYGTILSSQSSQAFDLIRYRVRDVPSENVPDESRPVESLLKVNLESDGALLTVEHGPIGQLFLVDS